MINFQSFRKKHPDLISCILISAIFIVIISVTMILRGDGFVWGSDTDWKSQHFAIPEYFRLRFYETHDIFPDFALQIGGGQNIYNFSYYGIANPLYLPAYALPFIKMSTYLQTVSLVTVLVSAILSYYFFKGHFQNKTSLLLAVMFLCSGGLIFHSHHHIMFMNYFPFLIGILIGIRRKNTSGNILLIAIMSYCILCTSFYFSVGCFATVLIYMIFLELLENNNFSIKSLLKNYYIKLIGAAAGCFCSAFMWMPTLMAILSGREKTSSTVMLSDILLLDVNLSTILYTGYSMGITAFVLFSAVYMFFKEKKYVRFLSLILFACILFPLINSIVNAFMYIDGKAFLPFGLLMLLIAGYFIHENKLDLRITVISSLLIISMGILNILLDDYNVEFKRLLIPVLAAVTFTGFFMIYICKKNKEKILPLYAVTGSILICVVNNYMDTFATSELVNEFYNPETEEIIQSTIENDTDMYRFANSVHNEVNINHIFDMSYLSTSSYSSINNPFLREFRFNTSLSENRIRNNAMQTQPYNILFTTLMGCRYRMSPEEMRMYGEEIITKHKNYTIYRNDYAFPLGYASPSVMGEDVFTELPPYLKAEALLNNIIIPGIDEGTPIQNTEQIFPDMTPMMTDPHIIYEDGIYTVNTQTEFTVELMLEKLDKNKILMITTTADNRIGNPLMYSDIFLDINGVKNKLTDPRWKYCNQNYDFTYVLSSYEIADRLTMTFSPGYYTISDIQVYALDASVLDETKNNIDELIIDRNKSLYDSIEGTIDVKNDGWFNISLPYDKNFRISLDGEKIEYFKTNTAFIGFPVTSGKHDIVITYEAPLKKSGIITSITSAVFLISLLVFIRIKKHKI